jgi:hypothetical protein
MIPVWQRIAHALRGEEGVTFAELLVAAALTGLILGGATLLLIQGQQAYLVGANQLEVQQNARIGIERVIREIRSAGYNPKGVAFTAVLNPTPTGMTLQSDADGNGVLGPGDVVTYLLVGSTLQRTPNDGTGNQPVIEGVQALNFTYLDGAGIATAIPANIRSVVVSITTQPEIVPDSWQGGKVAVTMTDRVRFRNVQ